MVIVMETTITTDKNNFFYGGQHARRFKNAARLRGERKDVVFTSCLCCFQLNKLYTFLHVLHG